MSQKVISEHTAKYIFSVPDGLDLDDKTKVQKWWIKGCILYIKLVDEHDTIQVYANNSSHKGVGRAFLLKQKTDL